MAESWYRAETVCHCYKSRNHGNEYFDKCKDMLVSIRQRRLAPTPQPPRLPFLSQSKPTRCMHRRLCPVLRRRS